MNIPQNLRYTRTDEWIRLEDDGTATIGAQGPSEPWGLSGTPQTTGAPTFEPAAFEVAASGGEATVTLQAR